MLSTITLGMRVVVTRSRRATPRRRPARTAAGAIPALACVLFGLGFLGVPWGVCAGQALPRPGAPPHAPVAAADSVPGWGRGLGFGLAFAFTQARDDLLAPLCWQGPGMGSLPRPGATRRVGREWRSVRRASVHLPAALAQQPSST